MSTSSISILTEPDYTDMVNSNGSSPAQIEFVLAAAERDLDNADFHFGFIFNPLRGIVLKPALGVANVVLPTVAKNVPFVDGVSSAVLDAAANVGRHVYHMTHKEQDEAEYQITRKANKKFEMTEEQEEMVRQILLQSKSSLHNAKGFVVSASIEILSDPFTQGQEWFRFTSQLIDYLNKSGISKEMKLKNKTLHYGQAMRVLAHIQSMQDNVNIRRSETAIPNDQVRYFNPNTLPKVAKLMRYACAAFGEQMMEAYDIVAEKYDAEKSKRYKQLVGNEALKTQVAEYVGIPTSYITYFAMGHGGSTKLLRHFVSVDEELGAVCLVIRGTYSISGWHIDFQGQAAPFCHGQAHKGMADAATNLYEHCRDIISDTLEKYPDYSLIITGESLGGGVSPLVNLLFHMDPEINKRDIECHAFAGNPVYTPNPDPPSSTAALIQRAYNDCIAYVNRADIVPYCSAHTVRRLIAKLTALDRVLQREAVFVPALTAAGIKPPTEEMVEAYMYGDQDIFPIAGAPVLVTPAAELVWFVQDDKSKEVDYVVCDPSKFIERGFLLALTGCDDHVPPKYCQVLNYAEDCCGWKRHDTNHKWLLESANGSNEDSQ